MPLRHLSTSCAPNRLNIRSSLSTESDTELKLESFILFINDISKFYCIKHSKIKLYADDIKLYFHFCYDKWSDLMQIDLFAIIAWAKMWQLSISINKTYVLHIDAKNPRHVYNINGQYIVARETVKDLGVHVTSDLNWSVQVNKVVKKAKRITNVILHAFRCHNVDLYMSAFAIYVKPILNYSNYVWNPVLYRNIDTTENVLRAYTRRVFKKCGLPRMSYSERLAFLGMSSLEFSRFVSCLNMFFKIYFHFVCCNVLNNFNCPKYLSNLRSHSKRLMIPFCNIIARKNFFTFRFLRVWNNLPSSIVLFNVSKAFSNRVFSLNLHKLSDFRYCSLFIVLFFIFMLL